MSRLAYILRDHQTDFLGTFGERMQTVHHRTLAHILTCHTAACGEIGSQCEDCLHDTVQHPSCGDRFCPSCQHLANSDWLARQQQKLLPVDYYMVTFTATRQLRPFVWHHQTWAYQALFDCAVSTLQSFLKLDKKLLGSAGLNVVLHTHARNLDFHPHVHVILPAGSFNKGRGLWRQKKVSTCLKPTI
jgi:hypothetical protein